MTRPSDQTIRTARQSRRPHRTTTTTIDLWMRAWCLVLAARLPVALWCGSGWLAKFEIARGRSSFANMIRVAIALLLNHTVRAQNRAEWTLWSTPHRANRMAKRNDDSLRDYIRVRIDMLPLCSGDTHEYKCVCVWFYRVNIILNMWDWLGEVLLAIFSSAAQLIRHTVRSMEWQNISYESSAPRVVVCKIKAHTGETHKYHICIYTIHILYRSLSNLFESGFDDLRELKPL